MRRIFALLALSACIAFAQTAITTARMDGTVTDPQGAVVVGAEVTVVSANGASFKATTDEHGQWALPSMPQATPKLAVTTSLRGSIGLCRPAVNDQQDDETDRCVEP